MKGLRLQLAAGAAAALVGAGLAAVQDPSAATVLVAAVVGGALGLVPRWPTAAWLVAAAALWVEAPSGELPFVAFALLVPAHALCAGWRASTASAVTALAALLAPVLVAVAVDHDSAVPAILLPGAAWAAGRGLRARETLAASLAERARELEDEREAYARLSVRYERARIASELHDIVAHAISVMVVQAGAGQRLAAVDAEATAETFDAIAGAARQAEEDMRRLVVLLADEEPIAPAPDLDVVQELVARAAGSGLDVTLRLEGEREGLPAPVVEATYRVVQESLTNALRYAPGAPVRVLVRGDGRALEVQVLNGASPRSGTLSGHGTGNGLRGLRERLDELGGTLDAGPAPDGGWRLAARVPRRPVASEGREARRPSPSYGPAG